ncbi:phage repressor protein CI [Escherichia coli]|uniref:phage repressor protein CI n=1 Tax=Escherichia coli TaxID=562 RepID=UPI0015947C23|nr:phage repressor protein CI [Escherichia coli]QKY41310.1 phage repressor protein CI [Escherichia coli]
MDFNSGGRKVIERLVEAYGFTTRQALADHLGVSKSTLATRYMRDIFPSDWVITCALQTGASLSWLVSGNGPIFDIERQDILRLHKQKIVDGNLYDAGTIFFDKTILPKNIVNPIVIEENNNIFIADSFFEDITDGKWLLSIDEKFSIRNVSRIPNNSVRVTKDDISFDCPIKDLNFKANIKKSFI